MGEIAVESGLHSADTAIWHLEEVVAKIPEEKSAAESRSDAVESARRTPLVSQVG